MPVVPVAESERLRCRRSSRDCGPLALAGLVLLALAPAASQADSILRELMRERVVAASTQLFTAAADAPTRAEDWQALARASSELHEIGEQLGSLGGSRDWQRHAGALAAAADLAAAAVDQRSEPKLAAAGDSLYAACEACHQQFLPAPVQAAGKETPNPPGKKPHES